MALGDEADSGKDDVTSDDNTFEVSLLADELSADNEKLTAALFSQDKLLKRAAHDRKEYKDKLEVALREL